MSESEDQGAASSSQAVAPVTAGQLLREAREAAGLHIASLAVSLKVPVRKLELLEADRFDELPDAVFVRALAASVCRNLKLDPAVVLPYLPQTSTPRLAADDGGINAPFRSPREQQSASALDHLSKPVLVAVMALLMGALVLIFLPSARNQDVSVAEPAVAAATTVQVSQSPVDASEAGKHSAGVTVALTAVDAPASAQASVTPGLSVATSTPTVVSPTVVVSPSPTLAKLAGVAIPSASGGSVTGAPPLAEGGIVVFKARGESWVEVTDAKGEVALRRTLARGETVGASGALPLSVVIGRVNVTDVQVRGKVFDLTSVAKDNVARFEVK